MNAKGIVAVLLLFAAVPDSYAEHFGCGSENTPYAAKPSVNSAATVDRIGRTSTHGNVVAAPKRESSPGFLSRRISPAGLEAGAVL